MLSRGICAETFHSHEAVFDIHATAFFLETYIFVLCSVKLTFWTKPWLLLFLVRTEFIFNRSQVIVEFLCLKKFLKKINWSPGLF